jgi:hypothetical protein
MNADKLRPAKPANLAKPAQPTSTESEPHTMSNAETITLTYASGRTRTVRIDTLPSLTPLTKERTR